MNGLDILMNGWKNNLMADWIQYFNGLKHEWNILMDGWMDGWKTAKKF